jgi:WD40 repeat protein
MKANTIRIGFLVLLSALVFGWDDLGLLRAQPGVDAHGDPLPRGALQRIGTVRFRHSSPVQALAYSPDGKILAAGGSHDPVRLWDAHSGEELRQLPALWVSALAFSSDGQLLATGGAFKTIHVWHVQQQRKVANLHGHTGTIRALAFAPDGKTLVSASQDGTVRIWNVQEQNEIGQLQGHQDEVWSLAISPDGQIAATGSKDYHIRFFQLNSRELSRTATAFGGVTGLVFAPDGKTVLSASDDGMIRTWNPQPNQDEGNWVGHKQIITALLLDRDGKTLISRGYDGEVKVWDWKNAKLLRSIPAGTDGDALALSPDGKTLAAAGQNHAVRFWNVDSGKEKPGDAGPLGAVTTLKVSPDGKLLVYADTTGAILWHDLAGNKNLGVRAAHSGGEVVLAFSTRGDWLASAAGADGVRLWDTARIKEEHQFAAQKDDAVLSLAFSPNGTYLAVGYRNGGVRFLDLATRKPFRTIPIPGAVKALAFSPDGKKLAAAADKKIVIWDAATGAKLKEYDGESGAACLAYSPEGLVLASGHYDGNVRLWNETSPDPILLEGHFSTVYSLVFSATGRMIASGSFDKTVRVWEVVSAGLVDTWTGHQGPIYSVGLANNGRDLISASADTSLLVWDVTRLQVDGKIADQDLTGQENQLWQNLTSVEAARAYQSLWKLAAGNKEGFALLRSRLNPVSRAKVDQMIADLDSKKFAIRTKANKDLLDCSGTMGIRVCLREAYQSAKTLEAKLRLEKILSRIDGPGALTIEQERILLARVMEVCEQAATPEALKLLEDLNQSALGPELATHARVALERLQKKGAGR